MLNNKKIKEWFMSYLQVGVWAFLMKWIVVSVVVGTIVGSISAFFLTSLQWVTDWRESHLWIVACLPLGGLLIGLLYHYLGDTATRGNNLLIDEIHQPSKRIPLRMAPLVLFSTLLTHLVGGSAGREGTAVQIGGAISDQLSKSKYFSMDERRILICIGISAGFASVFGTPIAGAIFALEVLVIGRMRYDAVLPCFLTAILSDYVCRMWGVPHTHYVISEVPEMSLERFFLVILAGILFGLTGKIFAQLTEFWADLFKSKIKYPPFRPLIGGIFIALSIWILGTTKYIGLGIPTIVEAFQTNLHGYDFALKMLLTTFTLGVGFKGGEVTPLFFVGAALGNALSFFIPLPISLLAGMGFVAVFAGATNTPIACILMGLELFGVESAAFIALACVISYSFSGHRGIYTAQKIGSAKQP
jgi:H+/Cl- antiporter ClcA